MAEVLMLTIQFESNGFKNTVYPTLIVDEEHMVLIDCGYPGFYPFLEEKVTAAGYHLNRLSHVIITHHDFDHMGALREIKDKLPQVKVLSSHIEADYISGRKKSLRLVQAEALYDQLPEEAKPGALAFQKMLENVAHCEVDQTLQDGEVLEICGGIVVVATPGHMPGHIALYHKETETLIVGDAMVIEHNKLSIANPQYTLDMPEALASIKKLSALDSQRVICYHGGMCEDNPKEAITMALTR